MELLYLPLSVYVLTIGFLRTRRIFYFSAANPKISMGGLACDSKFDIISQIPDHLRPKSVLILKTDTIDFLTNKISILAFKYPVIAKPDIGEGGFLVKKINSWTELLTYHNAYTMDYIVQDFIDEPLEISVMVHNTNGKIEVSNLTERQYLTFKGDGVSSLAKFIAKASTTQFKQEKIKKELKDQLNLVLKKDQIYQPLSIGNFYFGTKIVNQSRQITPEMSHIFQTLNNQIGLFNYGRYDIKCSKIEDLLSQNFHILEINGVKGEPIHIYDSKTTLFEAYFEIFKHSERILKISKRNIKAGVSCPGIIEGTKILYRHYKIKKDSLSPRNI